MSISVNHSVTAQLSQQATLGELKEFVEAAEQAGLAPSSRLTIQQYTGDQRDPGYTTITVRQR